MMDFKERMVQRSLLAIWWAVVGSAGAWLLVGAIAYWVKHGWLPADTDGWVQAIGSVAAICAAVWIANAQERKRQEHEKAKALEQAQKIASIASFVGDRVINACEFMSTPFSDNRELNLRFVDEVDECLALVMRVDLSHIPGADLAREWFHFVRWVSVVADQFQWRSGKRERGSLDHLMPPVHYVQQGKTHMAAVARAAGK